MIITSNSFRHKFFANSIAEYFTVCRIFAEEKAFDAGGKVCSELSKKHFRDRDEAEKRYFGEHAEFFAEDIVSEVKGGSINVFSYIEEISLLHPDVIAVFGSSLLDRLFLEKFGAGLVNMHLGLSPYYRGSGTNFWPLVNNEPEYVGATIHILALKADAGNILAQARPQIFPEDGPHDIGCRAIIAGTAAMIKVLKYYEPGKTKGIPQWRVDSAKVYKRKDVSDEAVQRMYTNFSRGMIREYLENKAEREKRIRLVADV